MPDSINRQPGQLIGVGVGPGDPAMLTLAALDAIRNADLVISPCSAPDIEGRAESIVRKVIPQIRCQRLIFEMATGESGIQARKRTAQNAARQLLAPLAQGKNIVFITLGDPNVFSTFSLVANQIRALDPKIAITTVPGIMAFQQVASESQVELLNETEKLFLITANESLDDLTDALDHPEAAIVIYKGGRHIDEIKEQLAKADRLSGAVVGELLGLDGERVTELDQIRESSIAYLATVIVPPVRNIPFTGNSKIKKEPLQ